MSEDSSTDNFAQLPDCARLTASDPNEVKNRVVNWAGFGMIAFILLMALARFGFRNALDVLQDYRVLLDVAGLSATLFVALMTLVTVREMVEARHAATRPQVWTSASVETARGGTFDNHDRIDLRFVISNYGRGPAVGLECDLTYGSLPRREGAHPPFIGQDLGRCPALLRPRRSWRPKADLHVSPKDALRRSQPGFLLLTITYYDTDGNYFRLRQVYNYFYQKTGDLESRGLGLRMEVLDFLPYGKRKSISNEGRALARLMTTIPYRRIFKRTR